MNRLEIIEIQKDKLRKIFEQKQYISENDFDDYKSSETKINFECSKGHKNSTQAKNLIYGNTGCKICSYEKKKIFLDLTILETDRYKKICNCCGEEKNKSMFGKNKKSEDGLRSTCKLCRRKQHSVISIDQINKRKKNSLDFHLKHPFRVLLQRCRSNHNKKSFTDGFNISEDYLKELYDKQYGKCFWSNIKMDFNTVGLNKLNTISVDRINSKIGYIKGNIVLTCKFMNLGRGETNYNDFIEFLEKYTVFNVDGLNNKIENLINE